MRVFDAETGMLLLEPMEEMEADALIAHQDYVVARCGGGAAMLVLKYTDGEEELEEVDFIDCASEEHGQQQEEEGERAFLMRGGRQADSASAFTLVGQQHAARGLHLRILKNRSYIT